MTTTVEAATIAPLQGMISGEAPQSPVAPALDHEALKTLMKDAVVEVSHERTALIGSIFKDASFAAAMDEGMESEEIPIDEVSKTLEAMRCAS